MFVLCEKDIGISISQYRRVFLIVDEAREFSLQIDEHAIVGLAAHNEASAAHKELVVLDDRAIPRGSQLFIIRREVIAELGIAADADFLVPPFPDRHIADPTALLHDLRFTFFFIRFQPDPLIEGNLLILQENVLSQTSPSVAPPAQRNQGGYENDLKRSSHCPEKPITHASSRPL